MSTMLDAAGRAILARLAEKIIDTPLDEGSGDRYVTFVLSEGDRSALVNALRMLIVDPAALEWAEAMPQRSERTADQSELAHPANPNPRRMAQQLQAVLIAKGIGIEDAVFRYHATVAIDHVLRAYIGGIEHLFGQLRREMAWTSRQDLPPVTLPVAGIEQMVRAAAFHAYVSCNSLESAIASATWPSDMPLKPESPRPSAQARSASPTVPEELAR